MKQENPIQKHIAPAYKWWNIIGVLLLWLSFITVYADQIGNIWSLATGELPINASEIYTNIVHIISLTSVTLYMVFIIRQTLYYKRIEPLRQRAASGEIASERERALVLWVTEKGKGNLWQHLEYYMREHKLDERENFEKCLATILVLQPHMLSKQSGATFAVA